ncbi:Uncharacterized protein SCF082_LOCUS26300, partial [Durusdinium trenchii]
VLVARLLPEHSYESSTASKRPLPLSIQHEEAMFDEDEDEDLAGDDATTVGGRSIKSSGSRTAWQSSDDKNKNKSKKRRRIPVVEEVILGRDQGASAKPKADRVAAARRNVHDYERGTSGEGTGVCAATANRLYRDVVADMLRAGSGQLGQASPPVVASNEVFESWIDDKWQNVQKCRKLQRVGPAQLVLPRGMQESFDNMAQLSLHVLLMERARWTDHNGILFTNDRAAAHADVVEGHVRARRPPDRAGGWAPETSALVASEAIGFCRSLLQQLVFLHSLRTDTQMTQPHNMLLFTHALVRVAPTFGLQDSFVYRCTSRALENFRVEHRLSLDVLLTDDTSDPLESLGSISDYKRNTLDALTRAELVDELAQVRAVLHRATAALEL